jgi:hypothetical protein
MNPTKRIASYLLCLSVLAFGLLLPLEHTSHASLTATIDKRAVQWSTSIVLAKLDNLGTKMDLPAGDGSTKRPSGRPVATGYRIVTFDVLENIDGSSQTGDTIRTVSLIGGQPGDGIGPAMPPEAVGKKFILLLRPFELTGVDVPDNTPLNVGTNAMVIVSLLGEADMNSETVNDLKTFVAKTRASTVNSDQLNAQVDTVANAHDDTEAGEAEKAIADIGPDALPALQARLATANDAGKTRLKHLIDDLSPPALSAEPD